MSNYAEEDNWKQSDKIKIGLKPVKEYGIKIINAAGRVIEEPNKHSKYTLAAWANLDISPACIKRGLELAPGESPNKEDKQQISELYLTAREDEDVIRQIAYAAFMGIRPLISNDEYDEMNK